jgi:hypothetical protein
MSTACTWLDVLAILLIQSIGYLQFRQESVVYRNSGRFHERSEKLPLNSVVCTVRGGR